MALNVPPAMTQAPTQGQQGQGNTAVSGVPLPGRARPRLGRDPWWSRLPLYLAEAAAGWGAWKCCLGFSDRKLCRTGYRLHLPVCSDCPVSVCDEMTACLLLASCCVMMSAARKVHGSRSVHRQQ